MGKILIFGEEFYIVGIVNVIFIRFIEFKVFFWSYMVGNGFKWVLKLGLGLV